MIIYTMKVIFLKCLILIVFSLLECKKQARRKQLQIGGGGGAHINFFTDWGGTHKFF